MRLMYALALVLAACASAGDGGGGNRPDGPGGDVVDAPSGGGDPPIDAPPPVDAAPQQVMLTQHVASTVTSSNALACTYGGFICPGCTAENSYYRVFELASPFEVQSVTFAVQTADAGGSSQPVQVKIGRYTGTPGGNTLDTQAIVPMNATTVQVPDNATSITAAITGVLGAGTNLIVELAIPDGFDQGNIFFVGTNRAGESKPAYIRAPGGNCNTSVPTSINALATQQGRARADLVMTVTGLKY